MNARCFIFIYFLDPNVENGIRLFNHYDGKGGVSQQDCFNLCRNAPKCLASTYDLSGRSCYFYEKYEKRPQAGWNSFFKKPQAKIAPAPAQGPVNLVSGI